MTPATDVYAFGVVLYKMVSGVCPFVADSPILTAIKRLSELPPPPTAHAPDLDPRWEATISDVSHAHPSSVQHVLDVLASLEGAESSRQRPTSIVAPMGSQRPIGGRRAHPAVLAHYAWYHGLDAVLPASHRLRCCRSRTSAAMPSRTTCQMASAKGSSIVFAAAWDQGRCSQFLVAVYNEADPREVARALDVADL